MIELEISVEGTDVFRSMQQRAAASISGAAGRFMRAQGAVFLQHANALTPVGQDWSSRGGFNLPGHPGLLARSNQLRVINQYAAEIVNTQPYAIYVARGTSPHTPPASSGLPWPVRRAIGIHGTRAQPWYDEAFQRGMQEVQGNLETMASDASGGSVVANEINTILEGIITTVTAAVPELHGYVHVVPSVVLPAVMAYPPDAIEYGETYDDAATMLFVIRLYVPQRQDGSDQRQLNDYISRDSSESVVAAIGENPRLGGVVADARVVQAANYGNWPVGSVTYLGVELRIQAMLL